MTEEKPSTPDVKPEAEHKKKRRTKGDECDRKYICKICQKTYLSYPALYTHTKSKHQKTPGKITESDILKKSKVVEPATYLNELVKLLSEDSHSAGQHYKLQQVLEPFEQKAELSNSVSFWSAGPQEKINEESKCFRTNIDQVIIKLLTALLNRVQLPRLQELCAILLIWRKCMNKQWKNYSISGTYNNFSQEADAQFFLRSVNDLVLTYFPNHSDQYLNKIGDLHILKGPAKDVNLCNILMSVSKWLHGEKYTREKLKYNEYE